MMKIYRLVLTAVAFCLLCTSIITLSLGWLTNVWPAAPALPFSAGNAPTYDFYKITFAKEDNLGSGASATANIEEGVDIGDAVDGFTINADNLQFGTLTNLYFLENDNYVFYAVKIPYSMGTQVHAAISYGAYNEDGSAAITFGNHFTIYKEDGSIYDGDNLADIRKIETTHGETFVSYACAVSANAPSAEMTFGTLDYLFKDKEMLPLATMTKNTGGTYDASPAEITTTTFAVAEGAETPEYYYLYIKLQPNMALYKYFIDYLVNYMPFYLAYQVGIQLSVTPAATAAN